MRASIRRIDLTQQPARVDAWPSMDWLSGDVAEPVPAVGPRGRGGLWTAMANAVARARQASPADSANDLFAVGADLRPEPTQVIDLAVQAPHLAYLARVAAGIEGTLGDDGTYEADVIVFDGPRPRFGQ
jgi:hypothetical protein